MYDRYQLLDQLNTFKLAEIEEHVEMIKMNARIKQQIFEQMKDYADLPPKPQLDALTHNF
jgi:hypothetical protein